MSHHNLQDSLGLCNDQCQVNQGNHFYQIFSKWQDGYISHLSSLFLHIPTKPSILAFQITGLEWTKWILWPGQRFWIEASISYIVNWFLWGSYLKYVTTHPILSVLYIIVPLLTFSSLENISWWIKWLIKPSQFLVMWKVQKCDKNIMMDQSYHPKDGYHPKYRTPMSWRNLITSEDCVHYLPWSSNIPMYTQAYLSMSGQSLSDVRDLGQPLPSSTQVAQTALHIFNSYNPVDYTCSESCHISLKTGTIPTRATSGPRAEIWRPLI